MQRHKDWLEFAKDDLNVAHTLIEPGHMSLRAALYHAQQCAEKALKAFLVYKTKTQPSRTHDLPGLVERCMIIDSEFKDLKQDAFDINPFSVSTRYPADAYHVPFLEDTQEIIKQSKKIFEFIENKIID